METLFTEVRQRGEEAASVYGARRQRMTTPEGIAVLDSFADGRGHCLFWRGMRTPAGGFLFPAAHRVITAEAGGWVLASSAGWQPNYWVPRLPVLRRIDEQGRILQEQACNIGSFEADADAIRIQVEHPEGLALDVVLWRFPPDAQDLSAELTRVDEAERSPVFLWGSHGVYRRPGDLYNHLIQGSVFDLRFSWPAKRRAYSENEAHALHLALRNKELETGKGLYRCLRHQVLLSVLDRQEADGAWRQGIWVEDMECHYRLHCSALHLLMDAYEERPDAALLDSLRHGAEFVAAQATEVMGETWFLHDSLEQSGSNDAVNPSPAYPCTNPGKTANNRLVLNTHVDTIVALHRYRTITRSGSFDKQIASARRLLHRLMELRPAEPLYQALFSAIYLVLLPTRRARALPSPIRALKRAARSYLVPFLPAVKCRFPRLVMPGGYIDRALSAKGLAHRYHGINLMDLARYRERFPEDRFVDDVIAGAIDFADHCDLIESWVEQPGSAYAVGFWIEALYRLCLCDPSAALRQRMGTALLAAAASGLGMPPSLGGRNCEALPPGDQVSRPGTADGLLWVVNLGARERWEVLILNPTDRPRSPRLGTTTPRGVIWTPGWGPDQPVGEEPPSLPPYSWVGARSA